MHYFKIKENARFMQFPGYPIYRLYKEKVTSSKGRDPHFLPRIRIRNTAQTGSMHGNFYVQCILYVQEVLTNFI